MAERKTPPKRHRRKKTFLWVFPLTLFLGICVLIAGLFVDEIETSEAQAKWFSAYGEKISFKMEPDANPKMRYPKGGPYNERLGYRYLPFYFKALKADDFTITAQMRASDAYDWLFRNGIYPIYRPKTVAGLTLYDRRGEKIYAASYPRQVFSNYEEIPPLLVNTLLYIENRELLKRGPVTRNPVMDWGRLFYALFGQAVKIIVPGFNAGGGSTLATQIEKFRFSPKGQTGSSIEKLRQIVSASLRVYMDGPDTRAARKNIVLDYLNSTPLSARPGFGEINSIGDGMWAWFGKDLETVTEALNLKEDTPEKLKKKAAIYRSVLGLILAQRRPSYYLQSNRDALDELVNGTLARLEKDMVISSALRRATREVKLDFIPHAPPAVEPIYIDRKAVNALRTHLMTLLGLKKLYEVDRLDIEGHTTFDRAAERELVDFLKQMKDKAFLESKGLYGFRLLKPDNDPAKIKWSVVLYEKGQTTNKIRLQADTIEGPFDMNEGMKLDLGSTAKLRTLVTYLEIIAELHRRYSGLEKEDLEDLNEESPDNLTSWVIEWLIKHPDSDLEATLRAAMERKYSAGTGEVFFTGGGAHTFHNFDRRQDHQSFTLRDALKDSVNLVFVRVMRDIVNYTISQGPQTKSELLGDKEAPARRAYLERFADQEGRIFLGRYIVDYLKLPPEERIERLLKRAHKGATSRTVVFRSVMPDADYESYVEFMRKHEGSEPVPENRLPKLFESYAIDRFSLSDRAYLAGVNPMELWLLQYWQKKPSATYRELMEVSRPVRIESYAWLYKDGRKQAQDTRIRIMLEKDAFVRIHKRWARLGYPFDRLVPSYATSIGSSADRPGALSELVGIILSDGIRKPVERFETLEFAKGTPFQTLLKHDPSARARQVLAPEVAMVLKEAMREVVNSGTATRVNKAYRDINGDIIPIGGKTGTGDQRYDEYGPGGRLISSRVVNRTGNFVFYIGDRFFGTITAHVAGRDAGDYVFTSALSAQMLKALAPIINPVVNGTSGKVEEQDQEKPIEPVEHIETSRQEPVATQSQTEPALESEPFDDAQPGASQEQEPLKPSVPEGSVSDVPSSEISAGTEAKQPVPDEQKKQDPAEKPSDQSKAKPFLSYEDYEAAFDPEEREEFEDEFEEFLKPKVRKKGAP